MSAHVVIDENEPKSRRELDFNDCLTIGRASASDVVIDQLDCSRHHAEIRRRADDGYELVDLNSRNGCFVNGHRVSGSRLLADGDLIEIAEITLRFSAPEAAGAARGQPGSGPRRAAAQTLSLPAIVLASDIVGYRRMLAELAPATFGGFVSEWLSEAGAVMRAHRGALDCMTSESVLAYWVVDQAEEPRGETALALRALGALCGLADEFAVSFRERFGGGRFRVATGLHVGPIDLGNAGATQDVVWTLLGSGLTVAVGLESLAEELGHGAVVSDAIVRVAPPELRFRSLGPAPIRDEGRQIEAFLLEKSASS